MATNSIKGLTIEIGGDTTKLGKALDDVNKRGRDLSQELGQINKLLKMDPGNTDLLAQKQKVLAEAVETTAEKLETLKEAEKQVQKQFERGEVSEEQVRALQREIIQTEKKMESYERASKETADEIDRLGDESKDAKKDVDKLGDESKETGKELEKAGDKASTFGEKAKKAGELAVKGLAAVSAVVAAAGAALVKASADAAAYADDILTTSTVTGISTEKLQAYSYAAELVDVSLETLTKSHAKQIKSMKAAQDGTKLAVDAYQKLGVEVMNADGSLRDGETVYWEVIDALGEMENETERDALAMQILGKSAQELNPLIEAGADKMAELTKEAKEVGAVMSDDALSALGEFDDAIQRLKGSAGAAKNALGTVLLPELTKLTQDGGALLAEFTQHLNASGGGLDGFVAAVGQMGDKLGGKVGEWAGLILTKASELLPSIIQVGLSLLTSLATTIIENLPSLIETGLQAGVAFLQGLTEAIPLLTEAIVDMIPELVDALVTGIPQLIDGAVQLFLAILDAIPLILPPLIEAIPQIVLTIIDALVAAIPDLLNGAVTFLLAIVQAIPLLLEELYPQIPTIVDAVINGLLDNLPLLIDGAIKLFFGILEAIPEIQMALVRNMPSIVSSIVSGLLRCIPELIKAGGQLLEGLIKGMMDFDIWGAIQGVGNAVVDGFKKVFDIHSPSRVMAGLGKMLDEGLAQGVEANAKAPVQALGDLSDAMLDEAGTLNGLTLERKLTHTFDAPETTAPGEGLSNKLDKIYQAILRGHIIMLDGKTLVGSTAVRYDNELGQRRVLAERGAL